MTIREYLSAQIVQQVPVILAIRLLRVVSAGFMLFWLVQSFRGKLNPDLPFSYLIIAAILFILSLYLSRQILRLKCPKCKVDLRYLLTDPNYSRLAGGDGLPETMFKCPYCEVPWDEEM